MPKKQSFQLTPDHGRPLIGDCYLAAGDNVKPLIIFCHGYKGFKDWGAWHLMAEQIVAAGFDFCKFNFSHNGGTPEQPIDFPDLDAFANNNYSLEMQDLQAVLDFVKSADCPLFTTVPASIYLLGHSRGGGIVALTAAQDERIDKVATLASVSDYRARFMEGTPHFDQWKETGITYVENSRTGQLLPHKFQFYTNFIKNEARLTLKTAVKKLQIPHLIIHGTADPTVPMAEAEALHRWNPHSELFTLDQADHVFGMKQPWLEDSLPNDMLLAVDKLIQFFKD